MTLQEAEAGEQPWCTLITVTFNSADALSRFWDRPLPGGVEWIVVDNASQDGTAELASRLGARVIRADENKGFSYANNLGLASARSDVVGFVNPDLRIDEPGLRALRELALDRRALVAPQLVNGDGSLQPNGRGYPFLTAKIRNRLLGDDPRYLLLADGDEPRPVCWFMGAAVFGSRVTIDAIGGWDSHFFLYYEDKDICLRAWSAGIEVLVSPSARFVHGWARETTSISFAPWRRELASMAKFYWRYPEFLLGARRARRRHPVIHRAVYGGR